MSSNTIPFTVVTPMITGASPTGGMPGTQVTITGSGFGASQGSGQVWLGTAPGAVQSWSDTQVVAVVASGSASGNALVLQNGVMSNGIPFTINTLQISAIGPVSGGAGTSVTITGSGFGTLQGSGSVLLGSTTAGQILTWSDSTIVATVAAGSGSGVVRVEQNGAWSNALTFTVPGVSVTLVPNVIDMMVGDTHTIQGLNSSSQLVMGLTWTSSNTNVVTLSTDDPPVLTAVGVGHSTITAGGATAVVNVSSMTSLFASRPVGTILWSNPGDGSGVASIIPAIYSPTTIADVFAIQNDGVVAAIASDGTTAWTADASNAINNGLLVPDFQGGLILYDGASIMKLDGITGQAYPAFRPTSGRLEGYEFGMVTHPSGTVFTVQSDGQQPPTYTVVGIDPVAGTERFSVPLPYNPNTSYRPLGGDFSHNNHLIVAGDGYAYLSYAYGDVVPCCQSTVTWHLKLLRVDSTGEWDNISVQDFVLPAYETPIFSMATISNADTGVLLSWWQDAGPTPEYRKGPSPKDQYLYSYSYGMAVTVGTNVSTTNNQVQPPNGFIAPALQLQDGSFAGTVQDQNSPGQTDMVRFDTTGNISWIVPNDQPQIATADGGVIGESGTIYGQGGDATGVIANMPIYSWLGNAYQVGSVEQVIPQPIFTATVFWAFLQATNSHGNTATQNQWFPELPSCTDNSGTCQGPLLARDLIYNARNDLVRQLATDSTCLSKAQQNVFDKIPTGGVLGFHTHPVDATAFVNYLRNITHYYNGVTSTLPKQYALCGENHPTCNIPATGQIRDDFGTGSETTADTVTPSNPLKTFWQPQYTPQGTGFGIGINPTNFGINIYNESNLFHEALHGFTGRGDFDMLGVKGLQALLGLPQQNDTTNVSVYIEDSLLTYCPSFR